ncbi:MAG: STAS domain-containing protein [Planctomycetota bacterium]|nr:STAS domain-containing protein [Planctomycetota bacterium]MDA1213292.1 STAS domain-containing protein [Planctomycetota bacterium]
MGNLQGPEITKHGRVTLISLGSDYENLDETRLDSLQPSLFMALDEADPPCVVLDLSRTKFFGSSFIEIIIRMVNTIESQRQGTFALSGLTTYCAEVLEITHLDSIWKIFPNSDEAIAALSKTP